MNVIDEIAAERRRQIEVKGWTPEHDDSHIGGELSSAAAVYATWYIPGLARRERQNDGVAMGNTLVQAEKYPS